MLGHKKLCYYLNSFDWVSVILTNEETKLLGVKKTVDMLTDENLFNYTVMQFRANFIFE